MIHVDDHEPMHVHAYGSGFAKIYLVPEVKTA